MGYISFHGEYEYPYYIALAELLKTTKLKTSQNI